jgi:GTPase SAR1 family protein
MIGHSVAARLAQEYQARDLNEADTRANIIDEVLRLVLAWPSDAIKREEKGESGTYDYKLSKRDGTSLLVVEAKREGKYFTLPGRLAKDNLRFHTSMNALLSDPEIAKAANQARGYAIDHGAQFCAITNGHEWIYFRTFEPGVDWKQLRAFVIVKLQYFVDFYIEATNALGYVAVTRNGSLSTLLSRHVAFNRPLYYPKDGVAFYGSLISQNKYAPHLRPLAEQFFGVIERGDHELMEACFVSDKEYRRALKDAQTVVADSVTPFLEEFRVRDIEDKETGGAFTARVEKGLRKGPLPQVVVLFGGKGVGKSTFLNRLLLHKTPQIVKKHSVVAIIDLLKVPESKEDLSKLIWEILVSELDRDRLLSADREVLINLFSDKFEIAERQQLYGLDKTSQAYNIKLNELVDKWTTDKKACARALAQYWARKHKGIIVVIDNTDQYEREVQDLCFATSHEIAKDLKCLSIISMREERFVASSIRGTLDAFHNAGFHISAPSPKKIFLKRLEYVSELVSKKQSRRALLGDDISEESAETIRKVIRILSHEFSKQASHLAEFLSACAHGNIRLALELFRGFVLSRYTNIDEMVSGKSGWTLQIHQVLKPVMIPFRFYYQESESYVPNLYQIRSKSHGSHFTAIRMLNRLAANQDPSNPAYISVSLLAGDFVDTFNMTEDFQLNLDMLLKHKLVESTNRLDSYTTEVESVRITSYGLYLLNQASRFFTYVDLVAIDTPIAEEQVANEIGRLSNKEHELWELGLGDPSRRRERVEARIEKANVFVQYLYDEDVREMARFGLDDKSALMPDIKANYEEDIKSVRRSAGRQRY